MQISNKILLALIIIVMLLCVLAIATNFVIGQKQEKVILIGYAKYSERWKQIRNGAEVAAKRNGYDFESVTCDSRRDIEKQQKLIDDAIEKEFDAIILLPTDIYQLEERLVEARKKGIEVVVVGDVEEKVNFKYSSMDYYKAGRDMARFIDENTDDLTTVFCLVSRDGSKDATSAYDGFKEHAESTDKISIATRTTIQTDVNIAMATMKDFLEEDNMVDYIITFEDDLTVGAGMGLFEAKENKIKIVGIGSSSDAIVQIDKGYIDYLIYENYYSIGYNAILCAFDGSSFGFETQMISVTKDNMFKKEVQNVIFTID